MKRILLILAVTLAFMPLLKSTASGRPLSSIGPVVSPNRGLSVDLWSDRNQDEVYYPGDAVDLFFRANDDCFVSIYSIGSDGDVELLFPRYPDDGFVFGGMTYRLPEYYDDWGYRISGPTGVEYLHAVASRTPRSFRYGSSNGRYHLGIDPVVGDPFLAINTINNRLIRSNRIHATATLSFFIGSRVWYPRYMCYDCHGRSARFDPYAVACPRYSVRLSHDYDYWWAYDYHPVSRLFVFGGPFWRFELRTTSPHKYYSGRYIDYALGHRNYYPIRTIVRAPKTVVYKSPVITTRRSYQTSRERVTYSETRTRTVLREDGTRVRTTGNSRTVSPAEGATRSRTESSSVTAPATRSRTESSTVTAPATRSRTESSTVTAPATRSRTESSTVTAPATRNISVPSQAPRENPSVGRSTPSSSTTRSMTRSSSSSSPDRESSVSRERQDDAASGGSSRESGSSSGGTRSINRGSTRSR
ncbi:MAG: DUF4384 domain-containing protein [Bacteroidetes bacterium]|nr:DUF4384 domain-containing protein [Bacteroidota bacterium]